MHKFFKHFKFFCLNYLFNYLLSHFNAHFLDIVQFHGLGSHRLMAYLISRFCWHDSKRPNPDVAVIDYCSALCTVYQTSFFFTACIYQAHSS